MVPPRRRMRKARKGRNRNRVVAIPGTLAPQHMITKLKYITNLGKNIPATTTASFNQFRLNSIYDPDYTTALSGTSVLGWSQWNSLYQRYRVFKCAYKFTFSNLAADAIVNGAIVPANYLDTAFSISDFMRPLAKRFSIGNRDGQNKTVVRGVINLPKLSGVSPVQYRTDDRNEAGFSANPSNPNILTVVLANGGGVTAGIVCQVEFTYWVELMSTQAGVEALDHATGLPVVPTSNFCTPFSVPS